MFNNPLRKYQSGGTAPSQQEQEIMAAFIQWLPTKIPEFQQMQPEQIVEQLNQMSQTEEGKNYINDLMAQFYQEMQGQTMRNGGKIKDFICKHAKGGRVDCGCNGTKVSIGQKGIAGISEKDPSAKKAKKNASKAENQYGIGRRWQGTYVNGNGEKWLYESGDVNGNSAETFVRALPGDTTFVQKIAMPYDGYRIVAGNQNSPQWYNGMATRMRPELNKLQPGGEIPEGYTGLNRRQSIKKLMQEGMSRRSARTMYDRRAEIVPDGVKNGLPTRVAYGHEGTSKEDITYDLFGEDNSYNDYRKDYRNILRSMRRNTGDYRNSRRNVSDKVLRQIAWEQVMNNKQNPINGDTDSVYYEPYIDTRMYRSADGTTLNYGPNGGSVKEPYDKNGGKIAKVVKRK